MTLQGSQQRIALVAIRTGILVFSRGVFADELTLSGGYPVRRRLNVLVRRNGVAPSYGDECIGEYLPVTWRAQWRSGLRVWLCVAAKPLHGTFVFLSRCLRPGGCSLGANAPSAVFRGKCSPAGSVGGRGLAGNTWVHLYTQRRSISYIYKLIYKPCGRVAWQVPVCFRMQRAPGGFFNSDQ